MSASSPKGGGFGPARLTAQHFQAFQALAFFFKEYLAENPLIKWSIVAAGGGAVIEALHVAWLAIRFIFRF